MTSASPSPTHPVSTNLVNTSHVSFQHEASPLVSIILIGWRRAPYLLGCLRALQAQVKAIAYEVILILNEPDEALVSVVERDLSGVTILRSRTNLGFAGAINFAAGHARGEFLVLLNDDTEVQANWLETLVETMRRHPSVGAVGSKILLGDGSLQEAGSVVWSDGWTFTVGRGLHGETKRFDYERRVDYCSGCSLMIRRALFEELGGLDESYYPAYFEDADLCLRIVAAGWQIRFQPRSVVRHFESASTNESFRQFLLDHNHEIFFNRWKETLSSREERVAAHEPAVERAVWRAMGQPQRILLIDDRVPDAAVGSGFARMADVLAELAETGRYHLSLLCSLTDGHLANDELGRLGIEVIDEDLELHLHKQGLGYALVVISRPHNYERLIEEVRRLLPGVPVVYDAEALYFRRIERQAVFAIDPLERLALEREAEKMRSVEAAIARGADQIVCISREEAEFFSGFAKAPVEVNAPFLAEPKPTAAGFSERADIAYVAGWAAGPRSPNADGLVWFVRKVLPGIRARVPGARLLVTGAGPPENVRRLASDAVSLLGKVEDLEDFYAHVRVVVAPVRYGAGVKIKAIEALQFGLPTVSTAVGIEGIPIDHPDVLPGLDDPDAFAGEVARLLSDERAWEERRALILAQHDRWNAARAEPLWPRLVERLLDLASAPRR